MAWTVEDRRRYAPAIHEMTRQGMMVRLAQTVEAIDPQPKQRVLEIGTGSGYQAAVLAELVAEVYTIELVPELAEEATARLKRLGYKNVHTRAGDGYKGWPDKAPFDAVVVTCGAEHVPEPLFEQLKPGGRMVLPVGATNAQTLTVLDKDALGRVTRRQLLPVRFSRLRGRSGTACGSADGS